MGYEGRGIKWGSTIMKNDKSHLQHVLGELTALNDRLHLLRPLPSQLVVRLKADFLIKSTYESNAIEGNTLTIYETKAILEDGITIAGKSMREHLEAINHKQAIILSEKIVKKDEGFSERIIKELHAIILHGIDQSNAGVYRSQNVIISGEKHTPPSYTEVSFLMKELIVWYSEEKDLHPLEKAVMLHSKFVNIHPFIDGNGRTSRLLMNLVLLKAGYLPVIIESERRFKYYEVLDIAATEGNYTPFIQLVADYELQELQRYLELIDEHKDSERS